MFNLKEVVKKYPECLDSEDKLKAYLSDLYPNEKAKINIVVSIYKNEMFDKIKQSKNIDDMEIERFCTILEKDFGFSKSISKECILLWVEVFNNVKRTKKSRSNEQLSYPTDLLKYHKANFSNDVSLQAEAIKLGTLFNSFNVNAEILEVNKGPIITRFEVRPAPGVKISKIKSLSEDIALAFGVSKIHIEAPIPNKSAIGIDIPNKVREIVSLREVIESHENMNRTSELTVALGKGSIGDTFTFDLEKSANILIAGTTGSGKSVCLNAMITNIIYNSQPDRVKLLLIDTNEVEFGIYSGIPQLLVPVISNPDKAAGALKWAALETQQRYKLFSENGVRDINGYNNLAKKDSSITYMPHICIFIDELSELMTSAPDDVEDSICRIAQTARMTGVHLIIATQRPDSKTISGLIKANFSTRISFKVQSKADSNIILDESGAENLIGNGDMLFRTIGMPKPLRIQGCFVSEAEIKDVVNYIKNLNPEPNRYNEIVIQEIENRTKTADVASYDDDDSGPDEMLPECIEIVVEAQMASTTLLQRKLKLGYARAARIIDELEQRHIVGPFEGSKPRKVLISKQQWMEMNALGKVTTPAEESVQDYTPQSTESSFQFDESSDDIEVQGSFVDETDERMKKGLCQYCGGEFKGLFTKKCSVCGKKKDY